jgi:hypothetical protein
MGALPSILALPLAALALLLSVLALIRGGAPRRKGNDVSLERNDRTPDKDRNPGLSVNPDQLARSVAPVLAKSLENLLEEFLRTEISKAISPLSIEVKALRRSQESLLAEIQRLSRELESAKGVPGRRAEAEPDWSGPASAAGPAESERSRFPVEPPVRQERLPAARGTEQPSRKQGAGPGDPVSIWNHVGVSGFPDAVTKQGLRCSEDPEGYLLVTGDVSGATLVFPGDVDRRSTTFEKLFSKTGDGARMVLARPATLKVPTKKAVADVSFLDIEKGEVLLK